MAFFAGSQTRLALAAPLGLLLSIAGGLGSAGCGARAHTGATDPSVTVKAWRQAIGNDDPKAAYTLLAPALQKQMPYPEFERKWRESQAERARQAKALAVDPDAAGTTAEVALDGGKSAVLRREGNFWRFDVPLVAQTRAQTPQEALRLFGSAIEERNFFMVMRLLTPGRKEGLGNLIDGFVGGLRNYAGTAVTVTDDMALIEWRDGNITWKVTLKRVDGEWFVDDVDFY